MHCLYDIRSLVGGWEGGGKGGRGRIGEEGGGGALARWEEWRSQVEGLEE